MRSRPPPLRPRLRARLGPLVAAAALAAGCGGSSSPPAPRGILFVVVDCLRADHLGAYGATLGASPRLDALAAESVVFERVWSAGGWTRPSVPSLLTGLYPSEHGLTDEFKIGPGRERSKLEANTLAPEAETLAEGLTARGYRTALLGNQGQLSRRFRLHQGFADYRYQLGSAANIRKRFESWLAGLEQEPFFAYLHFLELHWPYCPRETLGAIDGEPGSRTFCEDRQELAFRLSRGQEKLSERDLRALRARYAEELLAVDLELGRVFDALRKRGRWDDTLVVVTSDHGEELFDHGSMLHGHSLYEELVHVPYLWKLPKPWGSGAGRRVGGLVEARSLAPTLLDAAGAPIPARVSAPSLLPWLLARESERAPAEFAVAESGELRAIRDARYKLILDGEKGTKQLFDLVADPAERFDLSAAQPERVAELERRLRAWRAGLKPLPAGPRRELDAQETRELEALGYLQ